jgi:hypothetical protein
MSSYIINLSESELSIVKKIAMSKGVLEDQAVKDLCSYALKIQERLLSGELSKEKIDELLNN